MYSHVNDTLQQPTRPDPVLRIRDGGMSADVAVAGARIQDVHKNGE